MKRQYGFIALILTILAVVLYLPKIDAMTAAVPITTLPVPNARLLGMGISYGTVLDDASMSDSNPAGLPYVRSAVQAGSRYFNNDLLLLGFTMVYNASNTDAFGVSMQRFSTSIDRVSLNGHAEGKMSIENVRLQAAYGKIIADLARGEVSIGSSIAYVDLTHTKTRGSGVLCGIGGVYTYNAMKISVRYKDIPVFLTLNERAVHYFGILEYGITYQWDINKSVSLLPVAGTQYHGTAITFGGGVEMCYRDMIFARCGFSQPIPGFTQLSSGIGILYGILGSDFRCDYTLTATGAFGFSHTITVSIIALSSNSVFSGISK